MFPKELLLGQSQESLFQSPACPKSEAKWIWFLAQAASTNKSLHPQQVIIVSGDLKHSWITQALAKQGHPFAGEKTLLCLTGSLAGFLAANTNRPSYLRYLRKNWGTHIPDNVTCSGVLLRPVLANPGPDTWKAAELKIARDILTRSSLAGADQITNLLREMPENWCVDSLIGLLRSHCLSIDEANFRANAMLIQVQVPSKAPNSSNTPENPLLNPADPEQTRPSSSCSAGGHQWSSTCLQFAWHRPAFSWRIR